MSANEKIAAFADGSYTDPRSLLARVFMFAAKGEPPSRGLLADIESFFQGSATDSYLFGLRLSEIGDLVDAYYDGEPDALDRCEETIRRLDEQARAFAGEVA